MNEVASEACPGIAGECGRPAHAKGLCSGHYNQRLREERAATGATCCRDDCMGPVENVKRQLCSRHYLRYLNHGDPAVTGRPDLGKTLEQRFWEKVNKDGPIPIQKPELGPCWVWTLEHDGHGYGQFIIMRGKRGYPQRAHRVAWELTRGASPGELDLDHLCRNRICVNPDHLEPVTNEENIRRGDAPPGINARKTHCDHGHEFTPENTYHPPKRPHTRQCRTCMRERKQARKVAA